MAWITGSATDHIQLLDKLIKAATGQGATAVAIVGGGTGYTIGDVLDVSGGTFDFRCKLRVTNVSSGIITAVVIAEGGSYTVTPTNAVAVTGPGNDDATFNLTFASNGWLQKRRSSQAVSATVGAGGSGGTNGTQTVTVVGGVGVTTAAQFSVTIAGNTITAVLGLVTAGLYEEVPANPVAVTGAGLVGATLNVTWAAPTTQEQVAILQGSGGGSDTIFVGIKTFLASAGAPPTGRTGSVISWQLNGFTAFNAALVYTAQAGISPGDAHTLSEGGAFVPLHDNGGSFPLAFWFSITPNRIIGIVKVRNGTVTHYAHFYMGFVNRFGSPSEWPYPLAIFGTTSRYDSLFNDTIIGHLTGLSQPIGMNTGGPGPGWYRRADSQWQDIKNSNGTVNSSGTQGRSTSQERTSFPGADPSLNVIGSGDDVISNSPQDGFTFLDIIPTTGVPGTATITLHPTPNTGGALRRLYPCTIIFSISTEIDVFGELDGVFWASVADVTTPLTSEDEIVVGGTERYMVFKNGNQANDWSYTAIKEQ